MKLSYLIIILISITSRVLAIGQLGLCLGVHRAIDGQCKTADDYKKELSLLSKHTTHIRIFSATGCNALEILGPLAEKMGFSLGLGLWLKYEEDLKPELAALEKFLPSISQTTISFITVGSEVLYREDLTHEMFLTKILAVKNLVKNIKDKTGKLYSVPVGTADTWNMFIDGRTFPIIEACDIILANAFPYWQGVNVNKARVTLLDDIAQALNVVQKVKKEIHVKFWVGETGWPTHGPSYGEAHPGIEEAKNFWENSIKLMRLLDINVFVFEAFDEPWKPDTKSDTGELVEGVEKYWGIYDKHSNLKYDL